MKIYLKNKELMKALLRKNKSQNWFAHKTQISSGYMSQLMNGTRNPSPKVRERIINLLPELNFDELFRIEE